tara:strand:- start:1104 stop:1940 length:837 start_codon:yes stop_codon:yes gene_type:complete
MKNLKNKNVLVTGGARGIGRQIALEFAKRGANIIIGDADKSFMNDSEFGDVINEIKNFGVACFFYHLDVTDLAIIKEVRKKINQDIGRIDILVNNAGVVFGGKFLDVDIDKHRLTYDVNTQGIVNMTYIFLEDLISRNSSHIVNIASASSFTPLPGGATYASSKAAVYSLTESLYIEFKKDKNNHIGITAVCPAFVNTGMFDGVKEPIFIPMLKTEKLAKKIVKAVMKNKLFVLEPIFIKFIPILKVCLPRFMFDSLGKILGGFNSMDLWKGHDRKKV